MSCSTGIYDEYVPPEGDGKASMLSGAGVVQKKDFLTKKTRSFQATKTIRRFEGDDWDGHSFAAQATEIYKNAHEGMIRMECIPLFRDSHFSKSLTVVSGRESLAEAGEKSPDPRNLKKWLF